MKTDDKYRLAFLGIWFGWFLIVIVTFIIIILSGCSSVSTPPTTSDWTQTYGHNFTLKPYGNGFTFDFPATDGVHYITKPSGLLKVGQTITVTYKITGSGFKTVQANTGKPAFRLMFCVVMDPYGTNPGRYFSNPGHFEVKATGKDVTWDMAISITPDQWSDVYGGKGTEHLAEFKDTLANCGHVGITFGGDAGGYGHGVTGNGTFTLVSMEVK